MILNIPVYKRNSDPPPPHKTCSSGLPVQKILDEYETAVAENKTWFTLKIKIHDQYDDKTSSKKLYKCDTVDETMIIVQSEPKRKIISLSKEAY